MEDFVEPLVQLVIPSTTRLAINGSPYHQLKFNELLGSFTPIETPTNILNKLINNNIINNKYYIDLINGDILLYLIIRWFQRNQKGNKLIIITPDPLSEEIYGPIRRLTLSFPLTLAQPINIPTIRYHTRDFSNGGIEDPQLIEDLLEIILNLLYSTVGQDGNILVLVAGIPEVTTLTQRWNLDPPLLNLNQFKNLKNKQTGRIVIVPSIVSKTPGWCSHLSNFTATIDTLQEIQITTTSSGAMIPEIAIISQNQAERNSQYSPICYRMCTYDNYLRLPKRDRDPFRDNRFQKYELILDSSNQLTEKDRWTTQCPLNLRNGSILYDLLQTSIPLFPAVTALALIDSFEPNGLYFPFVYPLASSSIRSPSEYQQTISEHAEEYYGKYLGSSDLETLLNIWMSYLNETSGFEPTLTQTLRWAKAHRISISYLRRVKNLIKLTLNFIDRTPLIEIGPFSPQATVDQLRCYFKNNYPSAKHLSDPLTESDPIYIGKNGDLYHLSPYTNRSRLVSNPPSEIFILSSSTIKDYNLNYINIGLN